jgi:hypothetical protein
VWFTKVGTPVTSSNRKDRKLCDDDGGTDSCCNFFRGLDPETNVTFAISNDDDGLEAGALASTGLFLNGLDLWNFVSDLEHTN